MKILITNNTLSLLAGSETAAYTLALELKRQGHEVECFSFNLGFIASELKKEGIKCFNDIFALQKSQIKKKFDIVFASHYAPTQSIKGLGIPIVFTLHSIYGVGDPAHPETPIKDALRYVAISEEVGNIYKDKYNISNSKIIRNGIDLQKFKENLPRNKKLKKVLFNSNYVGDQHPALKTLREACNCLNIQLTCIGKDWERVWQVENLYNEVDMVFSLGRGCTEAMACNRPAVVYGHNGIDGLITKKNFKDLQKTNLSGRAKKERWDLNRTIEELKKYDNTTDYRELVKGRDIRKIAKQYLSLIK